MKLSLLSYNLNDLSGKQGRWRLWSFLADLHPPVDILCVQEHKVLPKNIQLLQEDIWREAQFVVAPASEVLPLVCHRNDGVMDGRGGVLLAIGPGLKGFLTKCGVLKNNQGVWIHIDHPLLGIIGIANIYAPEYAAERTMLWRDLFDSLDSKRQWIIMGNFNMVETPGDQRGESLCVVEGREKKAWNHLKHRLHLEDTFLQRPGHLRFSWDSEQEFRHNPTVQAADEIGGRVVKRLDRCYCSLPKRASKFSIQSIILPGFCLSEHAHAPVLSTLVAFPFGHRAQPFMPKSLITGHSESLLQNLSKM